MVSFARNLSGVARHSPLDSPAGSAKKIHVLARKAMIAVAVWPWPARYADIETRAREYPGSLFHADMKEWRRMAILHWAVERLLKQGVPSDVAEQRLAPARREAILGSPEIRRRSLDPNFD